MKKWLHIALACILYATGLPAQVTDSLGWHWESQGQVSIWANTNFSYQPHEQLGLRYIPKVTTEKRISELATFSAEGSLVLQGQAYGIPLDTLGAKATVDPYRLWARVYTPQFTLRAGLQKINFGSSTILRPLRWFDQIDPRDPLQITQGVYGILAKYVWLNNANIWVWGLYGNTDLKGWESLPTADRSIEWGGRLQLPTHKGELALSYHNREIDGRAWLGEDSIQETRVGIDAKWDIGFGLWIEGSYANQEFSVRRRVLLALLGADYTFKLGNGLNIGVEHLVASSGNTLMKSSNTTQLSAIQANYPLNFFNTLSTMVYMDWKAGNVYTFLNYQRDLALGALYIMAYWNPDVSVGFQTDNPATAYAGKGIQLMWVINY